MRALCKRASYHRPRGQGLAGRDPDLLRQTEGTLSGIPPGPQLVDRQALPTQRGAREDVFESAGQHRAGPSQQARKPVVHPLRAYHVPTRRGDQEDRA